MNHSSTVIDIAGDLLACFAQLIRTSHAPNEKTFFLARDGYLPYQLLADLGNYVHVSRQSLRLPLLSCNPQRAVAWSIDRATHNSIQSVLQRWDVTCESVSELLLGAGFALDETNNTMSSSKRRKFKNFLLSGEFISYAQSHLSQKMEVALDYLRVQGLLHESGGNIVDIGWNGSCHKHLQEYRRMAGVPEHKLGGIYVGLQQRSGFAEGTTLKALWEPSKVGSFLFSIDSFYVLSEMFLTANHGGVVGYESSDDGVRALTAPYDEGHFLKSWGLEEFQRCMIERATDRLADRSCNWDHLVEDTANRLAAFLTRPSRDDARRFGAWPVCVDPAHQQSYPLAPQMDVIDMWGYFVHRQPQPVLWRAGVASQLDDTERVVFELASMLDQAFSRCKTMVAKLILRN